VKPSSTSRKTTKLSDPLHKRVNMYALAGSAAGVGVLALAPPSDAKILYTHAHVLIPKDTNITRYIDLNHDGIQDFEVRHRFEQSSRFTLSSLNAFGASDRTSNRVMGVKQEHSPFSSAFALKAGAKIGPGPGFSRDHPLMAFATSPGSTFVLGYWAENKEGVKNRYLGLQFVIKGKVHYGWARLSTTVQQQGQGHSIAATLTGYAYETIPNKPIIAGKTEGAEESGVDEANPATVDEPTLQPASLGLLSIGSSGLSVWRREESVGSAP
jgi:hypothetical protein